MIRQRIAGSVSLGLCLLTLLPGLVYGQQTAAVVGTVTDATGATMPGTSITATSRGTGLTRSTVTNDQGNYALASLPVGTYTISAELDGFGTQVTEALSLAVNQTVRVDFALEVGDVTVYLRALPRRYARHLHCRSGRRLSRRARSPVRLRTVQPGRAPPLHW
ncbi:MAG: hypothetical protein GEU99_22250 [Luteitalea sp.]|nr:hypothetical protein [Luteitalea sp.]